MKTLLVILAALLAAVLLGAFADAGDGYVVIAAADWIVNTSVTFSAVVLFIAFILFYLLLRLLGKIISLPGNFRIWRKQRHQSRAEKYLIRGLTDMAEGKWKSAENAFLRSANYSRSPCINYLWAARAAQKRAALNQRDEYLRRAYRDNATLAVGITQAELQLDCEQNEQALAKLRDLHVKHPQQNRIQQLLLESYCRLEEWNPVLAILSQLEKKQALDNEYVLRCRLNAYAGLLILAGDKDEVTEINDIWDSIPSKLRKSAYLLNVYVTQRIRIGNAGNCDELLLSALKHNWDQSLVRLYGLVAMRDSLKKLGYMERFIKDHGHDAALLLTLGRLSIRNELWGKARGYLEESISVKPNSEACYELAALYGQEGNKEAAIECYQKGVAVAKKNQQPYRHNVEQTPDLFEFQARHN